MTNGVINSNTILNGRLKVQPWTSMQDEIKFEISCKTD